jgi:hypothetical protein
MKILSSKIQCFFQVWWSFEVWGLYNQQPIWRSLSRHRQVHWSSAFLRSRYCHNTVPSLRSRQLLFAHMFQRDVSSLLCCVVLVNVLALLCYVVLVNVLALLCYVVLVNVLALFVSQTPCEIQRSQFFCLFIMCSWGVVQKTFSPPRSFFLDWFQTYIALVVVFVVYLCVCCVFW